MAPKLFLPIREDAVKNIIGALNPVDLQTVTLLTEDNCDQEMIMAFLDQVKKPIPMHRKLPFFLTMLNIT